MTAIADLWKEWSRTNPEAIELDSDEWAAAVAELVDIAKHMGPGDHPSGSSQDVHATGRLAPQRGDVARNKVKVPAYITPDAGIAVEGSNLKATDIPITDFDAATAPAVGTSALPETFTRDLLVNKMYIYDMKPTDVYNNVVRLGENASNLYAEMNAGGGGDISTIPKWVMAKDYADVRDQLVTIDGKTWQWNEGAGDILHQRDRFYAYWHNAYAEIAAETNLDFDRVVAVGAAISPNLNANANLLYAHEIARMTAANPKLTPAQRTTINAKLEADGFDYQYRANANLLDGPDGQILARAAATIRATDEQWRLYLPENGTGFGVGRTWDNFAKGFDVISGRVTADDALTGVKIRSFVNNIMDPDNLSGMDDLTIDYQGIDFAYGMSGSGYITDITSAGAYAGVELGTRPLVADLIRTATFDPDGSASPLADALDVSHSLEMQEILWAQSKRENDYSGRSLPSFFRSEPLLNEKGTTRSIPDWVKANKAKWAKLTEKTQARIQKELWEEWTYLLAT